MKEEDFKKIMRTLNEECASGKGCAMTQRIAELTGLSPLEIDTVLERLYEKGYVHIANIDELRYTTTD